jgi:hypothetical protein
MDTEQLVLHSRSRFDHAAAKRTLKEKYEAKLIFAHNGGMFRAGPELINIISCIPGRIDLVIQDMYGNPVRINTHALKNLSADLWQSTMQQWLLEYDELNKKR